MKPATKIIGFTIIGAVVGALLGLLYGYLFGGRFIPVVFECSISGIIIGTLVFLEVSSINELTKKRSKLIRCLTLSFAIVLAFVIIIKLAPFLASYFGMTYYDLFVAPRLP